MGLLANVDSRVIEQNVNLPKLFTDQRRDPRAIVFTRHIGGHDHRLHAGIVTELFGGCLRLGLIPSDDGDFGSGRREAARHAEPDAAVAARDDGDLA